MIRLPNIRKERKTFILLGMNFIYFKTLARSPNTAFIHVYIHLVPVLIWDGKMCLLLKFVLLMNGKMMQMNMLRISNFQSFISNGYLRLVFVITDIFVFDNLSN